MARVKQQPTAPGSALFWRGAPSVIGATLPAPPKEPKAQRSSPAVKGRTAAKRAADRRDSLRRGGI